MKIISLGAGVAIPIVCLLIAALPAEAKPPHPTVTYDVSFQIEDRNESTCGMAGCKSEEIRASRLDGTKHIWVYKLDMTDSLGTFLTNAFPEWDTCFGTKLTGEILIQDVNNVADEINARYFFDAQDKNDLKTSYAFTMRCWVRPSDGWLPGVDGTPNTAILECDEWSIGINGRKRKNVALCSVDRPQKFSLTTTIKVDGPNSN